MQILSAAAEKFFIVFLILFSARSCLAQELTDLYKDLMPQQVQNSEKLIAQTSVILEQCEYLHPELFYFYMEDLKALYSTEGDEYFLNFSRIIGTYELKRRDWINKITEEVSKESIDKELKEMCLDFIEDNKGNLRNENINIEWSRVDKNFMDFIVVRYFLRDKTFIYNPEEIYSGKRKDLEKKIASAFTQNKDNPITAGNETADNYFFYWYVFDALNMQDETFKMSPVLIRTVRNIYGIKYNNHLSVSIGYSFQRNFITTGESAFGTPLYGKPEYKFNILPFSLSFNYRFFNSDYMGLFYSLNLQVTAGYGIGKSEIQTLDESSFRRTNVDGVSNRIEVYDFSNNKIKIKNMFFAAADLTADLPVYLFDKDLLVDLGAGCALVNTKYDLYYDYSYRKFEPGFIGPTIIKTENGEDVIKENTSTDFIVYPVINLKYYFMNPLMAQLGFTTNSVLFRIGINL